MTTTEVAPEQADAAGTVLGQLMGDFAATAGVVMTALGRRLGLWDALAAGPAQAGAVAERAGAALPYVREWLCSQAAAGYVSYDPAAQTFGLAPGVAAVLGDGRCRASLMGWRLSSRCGGRSSTATRPRSAPAPVSVGARWPPPGPGDRTSAP